MRLSRADAWRVCRELNHGKCVCERTQQRSPCAYLNMLFRIYSGCGDAVLRHERERLERGMSPETMLERALDA